MTIKELEAQGYKVWVDHYRRHPVTGNEFPAHWYREVKIPPAAKGGTTVVDIFDKDGNCLATGTAGCSDLDHFNKKLGRTIALGRAVAELTGVKSRRRARQIQETLDIHLQQAI